MTSTARPSAASQAPFALWSSLALETGEMLFAAAKVIGVRTNRLACAGPLPTARDRREFTLMGREKIEAATLSATAMGTQWMRLGTDLGLRTWRDLCETTLATLALASSRTPQESAARQAELTRTLVQSAASITELGNAGAHIAGRGLKPIHAAATANARRLTGR